VVRLSPEEQLDEEHLAGAFVPDRMLQVYIFAIRRALGSARTVGC